MNCQYCQRELIHIYREAGRDTVIENLDCYQCQVHYEYVMAPLEEPLLTHLAFHTIHINNREFEVQFNFVGKGTLVKAVIHKFEFEFIGTHPSTRHSTIKELVFTLPFVPDNWNPSNIQRKLQLLLPFA